MRVRLAHLAEESAVAYLESYRHLADIQIKHDLIAADCCRKYQAVPSVG